jgi:xanthine dehydrogenase molybdopterin-binding subunit B
MLGLSAFFAIRDAIGVSGGSHLQAPATPESVLLAMRGAPHE